MPNIDTALSYRQFTGHRDLAAAAGDLLPEFTVSTKVGFFPGGRHSLDPRELAEAVGRCCDELGRPADFVLLHNPERTLAGKSPDSACRSLAAASTAVAQAARENGCRGWGISTWDAAALMPAAGQGSGAARPDVLMVRAGLTVSARQLRAVRNLTCILSPRRTWGMSPFGGAPRDPVWAEINPAQFLLEGSRADPHEAAFRVARELPPADLVVAGTGDPGHLRRLVTAGALPVNSAAVRRYVALLDSRAAQDGAAGAATAARAASIDVSAPASTARERR